MSQEELQRNNDYAKFWRVKEVYDGICASRECCIFFSLSFAYVGISARRPMK